MNAGRLQFTVIGWPNRAGHEPSPEVRGELAAHTVFSGGERQHELVAPWLPAGHRWMPLRGGAAMLGRLAAETAQPVAVIASGDPWFYGIAGALRTAWPAAELRVFPWFNCVQLLCQRAGLAGDRLVTVSVHGRGWAALDAALIRGEPLLGVLTDAERTPAAVAQRLLAFGCDGYVMHAGEALEAPEERVRRLTLAEAAAREFHPLNCLVLQATAPAPRRYGLPESAFAGLKGRPDMITKMPVRLCSLAALDLGRRRCLWDVGFCTGSVAIEARLQFPHLAVVAFERRPEGLDLLTQNARTFGAPGITPVMGDFFAQDLAALPPPDAVFIGGHGGRLAPLIRRLDRVLAPGGRLVINAVRESTRADFSAATSALGYTAAAPLRLQVDDHNPILVLGATKPTGPAPALSS